MVGWKGGFSHVVLTQMRYVSKDYFLSNKIAEGHSHWPYTATPHPNINWLKPGINYGNCEWSFQKRLHQPSVFLCAKSTRKKLSGWKYILKIPQRQRPTHVRLKKIPCRFELQTLQCKSFHMAFSYNMFFVNLDFPWLAKEIRARGRKRGYVSQRKSPTI